MPRARPYVLGVLAVLAGLHANPAAAGPTFTDSTFNLGDYTVVGPDTTGGSVVTYSQCASCGNPGTALEVTTTVTGSGTSAIGFLNNSFTYDPSTQGALASIFASEDKNLTTTSSGTLGSSFRALLYQNGNYYISGIPFPNFTGPGTTGYQTASGFLTASSFNLYNFLTLTPDPSKHPDFAGSSFKLGIVILGSSISSSTTTLDFDNLVFTLIAVPEPSTWMLMLLGFGAIGMSARYRRKPTLAA
jgi:hypothetical protein